MNKPDTDTRTSRIQVFDNGVIRVRRGVYSQALATNNGRIFALGGAAENLKDAASDVIDLHKGMLLPAFGDGHCHPIFGGLEPEGPFVAGTNISDIQNHLRMWAEDHPDDRWIIAGSYDPSLVPGGSFDARWIDAVVPDKPVIIHAHDYHTIWCNTRALTCAHISSETPDPPLGHIDRREDGTPKGTLREWGAEDLVLNVAPQFKNDVLDRALKTACAVENARGVTWMQDAWVDAGMHKPYLRVAANGNLTARSNLAPRIDPRYWRKQIEQVQHMRQDVKDFDDPTMLDLHTVKFFADGVIESATGAMLDPYQGTENNRGMAVWEHDELVSAVQMMDSLGFQVHIHAIGDRAIRNALDAIEHAISVNSAWDRRPVITHVQLVNPRDLPRFKDLGVIANLESCWMSLDPLQKELTAPRLGPQRTREQYPAASLLREGVKLSHGSDWPISTNDPLQAIATAATRQTRTGEPEGGWIPSEKMTVDDAIDMAVAGSAYQAFAEGCRGSLDIGKQADMVWLEKDILHINPLLISDVNVLGTWLSGRQVYRR